MTIPTPTAEEAATMSNVGRRFTAKEKTAFLLGYRIGTKKRSIAETAENRKLVMALTADLARMSAELNDAVRRLLALDLTRRA